MMKHRTYFKASLREIKQSKGRFFSIMMIIFLGVFLFVGVKAAAPSLQNSANQELRDLKTSDIQVISTGGLTKKDIQSLKKLKATIDPGYLLYDADVKNNKVYELLSYHKNQLNQLKVKSGHLPKADNEIVMDAKAKKAGYHLGQTLTFDLPNDLRQKTYQLVGFVDSPLFVSNNERGASTVGNGSVDYFVYVPKENFKAEVYSTIYLTFSDLQKQNVYQNYYEKRVSKRLAQVKKVLKNRPGQRLAEIQAQANKPIDDAQKQLDAGKQQLQQAKQQLSPQIAIASQLPLAVQAKLKQAQADLQDKEGQLNKQQAQLDKQKQKIEQLDAPKYLYYTKDENAGIKSYGELTTQIDGIANVFPVFFFFIAALITFSTMTRMVEENRREIGILKALGYKKGTIAQKYILYASLATFFGILLGTVAGTNSLPYIINLFLTANFIFDKLHLSYATGAILLSVIACIFASLGAVAMVLVKELHEKPAYLLLPKAPKPGKRILLEYMTPLWSRFSFNQKVSYRNIFRYKSRMIMAIIGIAGCCGLMVAGVGLKHSFEAVIDEHFGPIVDYQGIVSLNDSSQKGRNKVEEVLYANPHVKAILPVEMQSMEYRKKSVPVMSFEEGKDNEKFVHLQDLRNKPLHLNNQGAIITHPFAKEYDLQKGDMLTLQDSDGRKYKIKVAAVAKYYIGNFIYMTKNYAEDIFGSNYQKNTLLIQVTKMSKSQEEKFSKKVLATNKVTNLTLMTGQIRLQKKMTDNLDIIVLIFVVLSGMLALVVLYNLTNINISERLRELSTIKVLGFYNKEVTMYIVRENIIFTILGIILGFGVGYLLTGFILYQVSFNPVIFPIKIHASAYLLASSMTILFTIIVMVITHFRLKHIHMIDALKSNE